MQLQRRLCSVCGGGWLCAHREPLTLASPRHADAKVPRLLHSGATPSHGPTTPSKRCAWRGRRYKEHVAGRLRRRPFDPTPRRATAAAPAVSERAPTTLGCAVAHASQRWPLFPFHSGLCSLSGPEAAERRLHGFGSNDETLAVTAVRASRDGRLIVAGAHSGVIRVWHVRATPAAPSPTADAPAPFPHAAPFRRQGLTR